MNTYTVEAEFLPAWEDSSCWYQRLYSGASLEEAKRIARAACWDYPQDHISVDRYENGRLAETVEFR
jgi:hypothetical protein